MMTKSKWINIIGSLIIGLMFGMLVLLIALLASGAFSFRKPLLVVYSDSNQKLYDGSPLTDRGWDMEGILKEGHNASVIYKGSRIEAGTSENIIELVITDEMGMDVTSDYNIQYQYGTLTVEPRKLVIVGETNGLTNGVLDSSSYQIASGCDGLIVGHREKISFTDGLADVKITDTAGAVFTKNYFIILQLDGNTFFPQSSDQKVTLFSIYSETADTVYLKMSSYGDYNGKENWKPAPRYEKLIDGKYSASYLTTFALSAMNGASAVPIKVQSLCGYYALPYYMSEGEYRVQTSDTIYSGNTDEQYSVSYYRFDDNAAALTGALGDFEKEYRNFVYANYLTLDETSRNYMNNLIQKQGFSAQDPDIISKVARFIQNSAVYNLDYPRSLETEENVAIAFLEQYKEGVCRHYSISATLLFRALGIPARYCVGALAFTEAGKWTEVPSDQAHAWVEVYLDGIGWIYVEVTGGGVSDDGGGGSSSSGGSGTVLELTPVTTRIPYDAQMHYPDQAVEGQLLGTLLAQGYRYEATVSGQGSEAGKTKTEIESFRLFDPSGNDVTEQYQRRVNPGVLHIYYDKFDFVGEGNEKAYDGKAINVALPDVSSDSKLIAYGLQAVIEATAEFPVGIGTHVYQFDVKLYQGDTDVTDKYWVNAVSGKLVIKPMSVTFQAGSAQKVYDGSALICHEYSIAAGNLYEGHYVGENVEFAGAQTKIGRSDNEIVSITIYDQDGNDVTKNYSITLLTGKLRVTPN